MRAFTVCGATATLLKAKVGLFKLNTLQFDSNWHMNAHQERKASYTFQLSTSYKTHC